MKTKKLKIGLVYGGKSAEHEVSVRTAKEIQKYLDPKKYQVTPFYISKTGEWPKKVKIDQLKAKIDFAFIAMHGPFGEDGKIQGFFETLGIPYTFSGVLASSLAMDKFRAQQLLATMQIPVPETVIVTKYQFAKKKKDVIKYAKRLGHTLIVKPNYLGSSVGVRKIKNTPQALTEALKETFKHDGQALIQEFVQGKEVTAPVLGNAQPKNLPLVEIVPTKVGSDFYDYAAKYEEGGSEHLIPAKLSKQLSKDIANMALLAHLTLGCRGVSRSDFIISDSGKIYYLETNTIPGMTPTSLLPQSAATAGINFPKLLDSIISLAL